MVARWPAWPERLEWGRWRRRSRSAERKAFPSGIDRIDWLPGDGSVKLDLLGTHQIQMNVDDLNAKLAVFRIKPA